MTEYGARDKSGPGGIVIGVLTYRRAEDLKMALPPARSTGSIP